MRDVKKVLVICAASRSGSSLLFEILRKSPVFYSLSGEAVPFYKLRGLDARYFGSDAVPSSFIPCDRQFSAISDDFCGDFHSVSLEKEVFGSGAILERYIDDLLLRFPLQWPGVAFSGPVFRRLTVKAFRLQKASAPCFNREDFYLELLALLKKVYPRINPYYYDIPTDKVRKKFPALRIPAGPPHGPFTIEEPPFILLSPRGNVAKKDLSDKILLLKSSVDCYRLPLLEKLFPCAEIKFIHLVRNPAASVNGLYDGWLYRGFFSYNLRFLLSGWTGRHKGLLSIRGYSGKRSWSRCWWKYDLPPGWREYTGRALEEVCVFQWYSANKAVIEYLKNRPGRSLRVNHEQIICGSLSRRREIEFILKFCGVRPENAGLERLRDIPTVQATFAPRPFRWKERAGLLLPLLKSPLISRFSRSLGYDPGNRKEWL